MPKSPPQGALDQMPPAAVKEITTDLMSLHNLGRVKTDQEVSDRIDRYFEFCGQSSIRPGVESLCLALGISRTTLFQWCRGVNCSPYRQELALTAKSFILSFMEQALLGGKISPPSGIFILKNWGNYKDTISFEDATETEEKKNSIGLSEMSRQLLAQKYGVADGDYKELPEVPED